MTAINLPNYQQTQVTTANTNRDGSGAGVNVVWTVGANGSLLSKIIITVPGTSAADVIRFFWSDGLTKRMYNEILVTAVTPSTSLACFRTEYIPSSAEIYPTGWVLLACTNQGQATNITVMGWNY